MTCCSCGFSPIVCMTEYTYLEYVDGSNVSVCQTLADTFWSKTFFLGGTLVFFALPLAILVILYSVIAINLMTHPGIIPLRRLENPTSAQRYRKKVVMMLGTVVTFFFVCLLPFRALIVWIVLAPHEEVMKLGNEGYYSLLYFCRIMFYLNSAINPILYNLMSSKFRNGFLKLCGIKKNCFRKHTRALLRTSTFNTSSLTAITTSSIHRTSVSEMAHRKKSFGDCPRRESSRHSRSSLLCKDLRASSRLKNYPNRTHGERRRDRERCHFKIVQINRRKMSRRKSFSDFLLTWESSIPVLSHSQSMDSVLGGRRRRASRKPRFFVKNSKKSEEGVKNISGREGSISGSLRNSKSSDLLQNERKEGEQRVKVDINSSKGKKPGDLKESFV